MGHTLKKVCGVHLQYAFGMHNIWALWRYEFKIDGAISQCGLRAQPGVACGSCNVNNNGLFTSQETERSWY